MGPMGNYIFGVTHYSHWSYRSHKSHVYADSWVSFSIPMTAWGAPFFVLGIVFDTYIRIGEPVRLF